MLFPKTEMQKIRPCPNDVKSWVRYRVEENRGVAAIVIGAKLSLLARFRGLKALFNTALTGHRSSWGMGKKDLTLEC